MVVRPARVSPAHSPSPSWAHELFGCDPTQGIVCVDADHAGHARVWRRVGSLLEATEHRFPDWFLTTTGRTYFKGMRFDDLRRFQFDLETTGLDEDRDRIFMVCMRDGTGWHECLDTSELSEAELIERFVALVQRRDPDVFENHNI